MALYEYRDEVGFSLKKLAKGAVKAVKKTVKSPIVKVAAGGLAVAFPAVGVPALAAVAAADKVVTAASSKNPRVANAAKRVIANTQKLAKTGDPATVRGVALLTAAAKAKKAGTSATATVTKKAAVKKAVAKAAPMMSGPKQSAPAATGVAVDGFFVDGAGRIQRGKFLRHG